MIVDNYGISTFAAIIDDNSVIVNGQRVIAYDQVGGVYYYE